MNWLRSSRLWPGVPLALASAILFGASAPAARAFLDTVAPQMLAGLLYLGAGVGLAVVHILRGRLRPLAVEAPLRRTDMPWLVAIIILGGVAGPLLMMLGLARTDAASGSLLLNLEGVATFAIAWIVFRESADRRLILGAIAIVAGAVVLSWPTAGTTLGYGGIFIAAACLAWGIDNNLTRKLSAADPVTIAMVKGIVAGTVNVGIALLLGEALPAVGTIAAVAVVGFFSIGVSLVLFVLALRHLGTARTGAYFSLAPFIGAALAVIFLHDPVSVALVIAAILMGAGLWAHLAERHAHDHEHDEFAHEHAHTHDEHHQHAHDGPVTEPHTHPHRHLPLRHSHAHYPDIHHRHRH